nr:MAG TPA: hypothetical protein [Bacteriophage sp.]
MGPGMYPFANLRPQSAHAMSLGVMRGRSRWSIICEPLSASGRAGRRAAYAGRVA